MADGALSTKTKELIALAIAVTERCDGCIAYHAKAAALQGATAEEVAEALAVALLMAGGPASVYGPRAWAAFCEFGEADPARPREQACSLHPPRGRSAPGRRHGQVLSL
jgi:AhpD family alkylhydroperoxidase